MRRLFERWRMRGREAELLRWHTGYRSWQHVQPTSKTMEWRPDQPDILQLHDRGGELLAWNRGGRTLGGLVYRRETFDDSRWWRGVIADHRENPEALELHERDYELQAWNQVNGQEHSPVVVRMS